MSVLFFAFAFPLYPRSKDSQSNLTILLLSLFDAFVDQSDYACNPEASRRPLDVIWWETTKA